MLCVSFHINTTLWVRFHTHMQRPKHISNCWEVSVSLQAPTTSDNEQISGWTFFSYCLVNTLAKYSIMSQKDEAFENKQELLGGAPPPTHPWPRTGLSEQETSKWNLIRAVCDLKVNHTLGHAAVKDAAVQQLHRGAGIKIHSVNRQY